MRLLLTSAGITNPSIGRALVELLGKPVAESRAMYVPTAIYPEPGGTGFAWEAIRELGGMGWRDFGVLELTALPTIPEEHWLPEVEAADIIMVGGGNTAYLSHWLHESGFAARLPELLESRVYFGVSAGGGMVTHSLNVDAGVLEKTGRYYDDEYDEYGPVDASSARTVRLVDFVIRPHLNADYFPNTSIEYMEKAAAKVDVPLYAIDDQTAIKVVDGHIEVVSEGDWKLFDK